MAPPQQVIRGNTAYWSVTFLDQSGDPTTPASANLYVNYPIATGRTEDTIAMTVTDGVWSASWNTGLAQIGNVFWSAWSAGPEASIDGQFQLVGNVANLAA